MRKSVGRMIVILTQTQCIFLIHCIFFDPVYFFWPSVSATPGYQGSSTWKHLEDLFKCPTRKREPARYGSFIFEVLANNLCETEICISEGRHRCTCLVNKPSVTEYFCVKPAWLNIKGHNKCPLGQRNELNFWHLLTTLVTKRKMLARSKVKLPDFSGNFPILILGGTIINSGHGFVGRGAGVDCSQGWLQRPSSFKWRSVSLGTSSSSSSWPLRWVA